MKILHYLLFIFSLSLIAYACTSDHPSGPESSDFDRQEMLKNWADNIIIPAFDSFKEETAQLKTAADGFTSNPTLETLNNLRATWETAYLSFQHVYMFEVGAAMNLRYHDNLNIYPADTEEIHKNIEGSYNLELPSLNNSQGFPALDYLLYGLSDADSELLSYYTTGENPEGYRAYLTDLTTRIDDLTGQVLTFWEEGFRNEFIENDGNGSNTSVDMMVNDYIFYYEKVLRAGKVGIPAGVFSGMPLSSHVEAYYRADLSKALLLEALTATQNFFNGKHFNSNENGESLSSYLDFLNAVKEGTDLTSLINSQFEAARAEVENLNDNFAQQIESDNSKVLSAYDELQMNVVYLKVDMLQALNINVDYVDADGD